MKIAMTAAALMLSIPAWGADMPAKQAALNAYAAVPGPTWAGFYIGLHAGYGFGEIKPSLAQDIITNIDKFDTKGIIGGGQLGVNWQYANVVAGVELDATWMNAKDTVNALKCEIDCGIAGKFDFVGTARGRLGVANGAWLFYGTGGLAWAHTAISSVDTAIGNTSLGWVAGGGVEAMLAQHWTIRAEFLHYAIGQDLLSKGDMNVVRIGTNLKF